MFFAFGRLGGGLGPGVRRQSVGSGASGPGLSHSRPGAASACDAVRGLGGERNPGPGQLTVGPAGRRPLGAPQPSLLRRGDTILKAGPGGRPASWRRARAPTAGGRPAAFSARPAARAGPGGREPAGILPSGRARARLPESQRRPAGSGGCNQQEHGRPHSGPARAPVRSGRAGQDPLRAQGGATRSGPASHRRAAPPTVTTAVRVRLSRAATGHHHHDALAAPAAGGRTAAGQPASGPA